MIKWLMNTFEIKSHITRANFAQHFIKQNIITINSSWPCFVLFKISRFPEDEPIRWHLKKFNMLSMLNEIDLKEPSISAQCCFLSKHGRQNSNKRKRSKFNDLIFWDGSACYRTSKIQRIFMKHKIQFILKKSIQYAM